MKGRETASSAPGQKPKKHPSNIPPYHLQQRVPSTLMGVNTWSPAYDAVWEDYGTCRRLARRSGLALSFDSLVLFLVHFLFTVCRPNVTRPVILLSAKLLSPDSLSLLKPWTTIDHLSLYYFINYFIMAMMRGAIAPPSEATHNCFSDLTFFPQPSGINLASSLTMVTREIVSSPCQNPINSF